MPILDQQGCVINVITKKQLHTLLLTDSYVDFTYDFSQLDENLQDYEIFSRPWGFYKTTVMNNYFQSKIISVLPGASLSLQSHNRREEYWVVAHGEGIVQIGESMIQVKCGSSLFIPKGCKHRLTNTDSESEFNTLIDPMVSKLISDEVTANGELDYLVIEVSEVQGWLGHLMKHHAALMSEAIRPEVAVITNIAMDHIGLVNSIEEVYE